jgi:DhnA family fructose-bisphosphate aldolase class Ia
LATQAPTGAPVTGGGGTAGFQNTLLLGLGAAAILAGAGGIAYRRRLSRHR